MSWIKDNKFVACLGGGTLLGAALLGYVGITKSAHYGEELDKFTLASEEVAGYDQLPLYPKTAHEDGKNKALAEYRRTIETLQTAFSRYGAKPSPDITPQEFTSKLLAANAEIRKAFEDVGGVVPEPFFVGFESYKTTLAPAKTTGILSYQLDVIQKILIALAKSKPAALKNLYRPVLPEEENQKYTPSPTEVCRSFPLEITFSASEPSARAFLNSLSSVENQMIVVRSLRVTNEKKDAPRSSDAKFDKPVINDPAGADVSSGGFVVPGEEAAAVEPKTTEPVVPVVDNSRILSQVLGNEKIQVFLRLDILEFSPAKKLP
jgi:hypothetical protein